MSDSSEAISVTGETIIEASFDPRIAGHGRWVVSLFLLITVAGALLIPFWLLFSLWYYPEYLRRLSARLTTQAVEIRKGVFFRKESTIPLNRITDVRLHDGPIMRHYDLRGLRVETAGQAGRTLAARATSSASSTRPPCATPSCASARWSSAANRPPQRPPPLPLPATPSS